MFNKNFKSVIALILSVMMTATSVFAAPSMAGVAMGAGESFVEEAAPVEEVQEEKAEASLKAEGSVAKVGNTEYATIDEAIANWTNNTTLTLLSDVTLSDVITLKSTEHHYLDLGTFTMTAASGKNVIEIKSMGFSDRGERGALTITADSTSPGCIDAGSKSVVYYKYDSKLTSTYDRPIIYIKGGVFKGASYAGFSSTGHTSAQDKCATFNISGGEFNCGLNLTKTKLLISGGVFNGSVSCTGGGTSLRLISGGKFKSFGFMTADASTKFAVGSDINKYDVGVYVDDKGYLVVGGPVITEAGDKFEASTTQYGKWSSYLVYSSAATYGLYYTDADLLISKKPADIDLFVSLENEIDANGEVVPFVLSSSLEVDMTNNNASYERDVQLSGTAKFTVVYSSANPYTGKVYPAEGKALKIEKEELAALAVESEKLYKVTYSSVAPVAKVGDTNYSTLEEAFKAVTATNNVVDILGDVTVDYTWDCRNTGSKFTVPVTINGNYHKLTFTGTISDKNYETIFKLEEGGTIKNLTIDASNASGIQRGVSFTKGTAVVENCNFIGNGTTARYAVIYGEGAGTAISEMNVKVTNSTFTNWSYGVSDNRNGQDAKTVEVSENNFENSKVLLSGSETVVFTNNTVTGGYVSIASYSAADSVVVNATGNTLEGTEDEIFANHVNVTADNAFALPPVRIGNTVYASLDKALDAASAMSGDVTVEIYDKVTLNKPLLGSYDTIKFIGKNADAEIYLDVTGYTTATGKKVAFEKLNLSKSNTGGHVANAGFMNVAFGLYDVVEVSYTDCVLKNGAYASSGKVTFTGCTFHSSHDRYGLWAYGSQDITVDGCTFASVRGIKVYDEGKFKLSGLTVKDTDFEAATGKPAIVLTSGKSVTLIGDNKYPGTGVFELDLDGNPDGTPVTVDVANLAALKCVNDDGDCGVLVNGKIYTTLAKADDAGVILAGTEVTLLHNSVVPVELPRGVKFTENGYTASNVTYEASNGTLTYVFTSTTGFWGEGTANAVDSFVVELYEGDKKIASASLSDSYIDGDVYATWCIPFVTSTGGAWTVNWETGYPNAFMNPTKGVLVADGVAVAENIIKYSGADDVAPIVAIAETANGVKAYTSFDAMELDASSITALKLMKSYTVDAGEEFTFNNTEFKAVNGAKVTVLGTLNINGASMTNMIIDGTGKLKLFGTVNFYGKNEVTPTVLEGEPFNLIVNKDATLKVTRFVLGYGRSIEVYGNIADAHNFDPTGVTPSLKFNSTSGVSIGGTDTGNLTVENAYVELDSSSWKYSEATHTWSFKNSYVSATSFGNCNAPGVDTASWTVTFDNSVLATKNYIKTGKNVTYNFTNNSVATTGSLRNDGTVYIDETSSLTTTGQQNNVVGAVDEHGGNNGTIKVAGVMTIASNAKTQLEMLGGSLELVSGTVNLGNNSLTLDAGSMLTSTGTKAGVINGDIVSEVPALELDNITVNGNVTAKSGEISIIDGTFGGALSGNVKVFGGMYKEDPTAYLAENTVANYRTTSKYWVVDKARTLYLVPVYGEDYTVKTSTEFKVEVYVDGVEPKGVRWDLAFNENYFELVSFTVNQGTNYGTATKPELIAERGTMNTEKAVATYVFKSKNIAVDDSPFTVSNVDIRTVENAWEETDVSGTITDEDTRISVENRTMTAVVYDGAEVVTATAIEVQHDPNKIFDMCVKAYEEVNGANVELTDAQITYTFKHGGTSETIADLPEFSDVGYYDVSYVIKKDGYTTVEGRFTVNIKYNQYVVEVKFDGEVLTTDNKKINYTGDAYKFEVTSTPNAKITYSVNGAATETAPEITEVGNYVIEYTVEGSASIGYQQVTKKVEITVLAPNYLVEVVFGEESDYVSGTKLVLVYTNASGVTFDFDGVKMLDVSNAGYTYLNRGETHKYVYALVVDAFKYGTTLDMYKAEITLDYENEASKIDYTVKEDVNLNGSVTWNDIISAYTVVEYDKYAFENQMEGFIKADTNRDKKATSADATPIINVVYGK